MFDQLAGGSVGVVGVVLVILMTMVFVGQAQARDGELPWRELDINAEKWDFGPSVWRLTDEGTIRPIVERLYKGKEANEGDKGRNIDDHLAFSTDTAYSDMEVEFDFRVEVNHGGAGFVFRAQDPSHYYMVYFPYCGQHYRAKHFWAAICKVGDSGWMEMLKMELVPGIPSELNVKIPEGPAMGVTPWHHARLVVKGDEFRVWVNGRPGPVVKDKSYRAGYIGLEAWTFAYRSAAFKNIRIRGKKARVKPWNASVTRPQNWTIPFPDQGERQGIAGITRAPNGDLLMNMHKLLRSKDNGRTWHEAKADGWNSGWLLTTKDGKLLSMRWENQQVTVKSSPDNGNTWTEVSKSDTIPLPDTVQASEGSINPFMSLDDGTMLFFLCTSHTSGGPAAKVTDWGSIHYMGYSFRSTDMGRTWSGATPLDGPPGTGVNYDLTEGYTVQLRDGRLLCLIRSIYSPWMWETWSEDGGKTWGPSARGSFPCYACVMLPHPTASGALVIGGRMPGLGLHVSRDDGMTWSHYQIGTDIWVGGSMYEVAPDVVMWVHGDSWESSARAEFIRITPTGIEPAREFLPKPVR